MKKRNIYYIVYETNPNVKGKVIQRRIYTFDNEMAANELVEFLIQHDAMPNDLSVVEYETPT